jgi:hypothetical protein
MQQEQPLQNASSEFGRHCGQAIVSRQVRWPPIQLLDAVQHHQGLPHQQEVWQLLQRSLTPEQLHAFAEAFRRSAIPQTVNGTGQAETALGGLIQLPVPYLSQNDSATGQGSRMCFASTCAMAAAFLKPDCLKGSGQLDDQFLAWLPDTSQP